VFLAYDQEEAYNGMKPAKTEVPIPDSILAIDEALDGLYANFAETPAVMNKLHEACFMRYPSDTAQSESESGSESEPESTSSNNEDGPPRDFSQLTREKSKILLAARINGAPSAARTRQLR